MQADRSANTETQPIPPRYRWLKRLVLLGVLLLFGLIGLRLVWGWHASRVFNETVARLIEAGLPLDRDAPEAPPLPDKQNAAWYLQQAVAALPPPGAFPFGPDDIEMYPDLRTDHPDIVTEVADAIEPVLPLVAQAHQHPADWGIRMRPPYTTVTMMHLGGQRNLARRLRLDGMRALQAGDRQRALQRVEDLFMIGDRLRQGEAVLIGALVANAVDSLGLMLLDSILCEPGVPLGDQEAAMLERLKVALGDETSARDANRRAIYAEALFAFDAVAAARESPLNAANYLTWGGGPTATSTSALGWVFLPMFELDAVRHMTLMHRAGNYAADPQSEDLGALLESGARTYKDMAGLQAIATMLSMMLAPSMSITTENIHREYARRRAGVIGIAARQYFEDQQQWPANADELVPKYLAEVPPDPRPTPPETEHGRVGMFDDRPTPLRPMCPNPETDAIPLRIKDAIKKYRSNQP